MLKQKLNRFLLIFSENGIRAAIYSTFNFIIEQAASVWQRTKNKVRYQAKYGGSAPTTYKLININPTNVDWLIVPRYIESEKYATYVRVGNWDTARSNESIHYLGTKEGYQYSDNPKLIPIENWTFYQSIENHFIGGVPWRETKIFEVLVQEYCRPGSRWGPTKETVLSRLSELELLYQDIDENGYLTQAQLHSRDNVYLNPPGENPPEKGEVLVNIGRDGEIIFCTGRHRFCVARVLGIEEILVRVHVRHKQWQEIRHQFYSRPLSEIDESIKKYRTHPDIRNLI